MLYVYLVRKITTKGLRKEHKTMKKRILFTLVAMALLLSAIAFSALAADVSPAVKAEDVETTSATIVIKNLIVGTKVKVEKVTDGGNVVLDNYKGTSAVTSTNADYVKTADIEYGTKSATNAAAKESEMGTYTVKGLSAGTYNIYVTLPTKFMAGSTPNRISYTESAATQVVCADLVNNGGKWDTPEYLYFDSARALAGVKDGEAYEVAKVTITATKDETTTTTGAFADYTLGTALDAGIWSVRVKAGDNGTEILGSSDPVVLLARGDNVGSVAAATSATNNLVAGKWTVVTNSTTSFSPEFNEPNAGVFVTVQQNKELDFLTSTVSYLMSDDEILPVDGFRGWPNGTGGYFRITTAVSQLLKEPKIVSAKVVAHYVYVEEGDIKNGTYEVPVTWEVGENSIMNADFKNVIPEGAEGYIYRIDFDVVDEEVHADDSLVADASNYSQPRVLFQSYYSTITKRININAKKVVDAPVLYAQGTDEANKAEFFGFAGNLEYMYSDDNGTTWKSVGPKGTQSIKLPTGKSYLFYSVGDSSYYQSPTTKITVTGVADPLTALTLSADGTVTGFRNVGAGSQVNFEWCEMPLGSLPTWTSEVGSGSSATTLTNATDSFKLDKTGFYAFRIKSGSTLTAAGKPQYIFYYDSITPNSTRGTIATTSGSYQASNPSAFSKGGWITSLGGCYTIQDNKYLIYGPYKANTDNVAQLSWKYALTANEIFPLSDFAHISFQLRLGHNGTIFNTNAYNGRLVIHVVDNNEFVKYEIPTTFIHGQTTPIEVTSLWKDEVAADPNFIPSGYVVGLEVFYMNDTEGIEAQLGTTGEPKSDSISFKVVQANYSSNTNSARVEIGYKADAEIDTLTTRNAIGDAKGAILGLKPACEYEVYHVQEDGTLGSLYMKIGQGNYSAPIPAGKYAVRSFVSADYCPSDLSQICGTSGYKQIVIDQVDASAEVANVPKVIMPSDVIYSETAEYEFDITTARWVNRITLVNIAETQPDATLTFKTNKYAYTVKASDIDLSENNAHYFDMKVTFNGEMLYDKAYDKMVAKADKDELIMGIHFESTTGYFFEVGTFSLYVGEKYNGCEMELTSFNERVGRLKKEEAATVKEGWVEFSTVGGDYLILSPDAAAQ